MKGGNKDKMRSVPTPSKPPRRKQLENYRSKMGMSKEAFDAMNNETTRVKVEKDY